MRCVYLLSVGLIALFTCCSVSAGLFHDPYSPLCGAVNKLGFDILKQLPQDEDILFSPYNFFKLTAMVGSLLTDEQSKTVFKKLGVPDKQTEVGRQLVAMGRSYTREEGAREDCGALRAGCWALLVDGVDGSPLNAAVNDFGAKLKRFTAGNSRQAVSELNAEIERFTDHKLVNFVQPLTPQAPLDFYSVFYFKELWVEPFLRLSGKFKFTGPSGGRDVAVMCQKFSKTAYYSEAGSRVKGWFGDWLGGYWLGGWTAVTIPCKDPTVYLLIVMPDSVHQRLDLDIFNRIYDGLQETKNVRISMPLYRVNYEISEPVKYLKQFGLPGVMTFKDMDITTPEWDALHQSQIDVDEVGMTGVDALVVQRAGPPEKTTCVNINRSFYFMVMRVGGAILDLGHVVYPEQPEDLLAKRQRRTRVH